MNKASPELIEKIQSIVGAEYVLTAASGTKMDDYRKDMGDYISEPAAVVQPKSENEVSMILRMLNEERVPVVARGAGTSLTGATSCFGGVVIDFSERMNRILKIDTVNWYVHCEAGVVIDDLNQELSKYGFFFPPDPASTPWCTVGGVIAENSGGMRTFRYGTVKNWVLALRIVLADGSIVKLGEPLPKNRVGYDLVDLVCGSEGTLALVTDAWLKIVPLPGRHGTSAVRKLMIFFDSWDRAVSSISALRSGGIQPNLIEFISREAIHAVNDAFETNVPEHEAILFMESSVEMVPEIVEICKRCGSVDSYIATDQKDEERLHNARALILLGVKALGSAVYNEDVVVPIDKLGEYLESVRSVAKKYDLFIPTFGHAGDGNVHPTIVYDSQSDESKRNAEKAYGDLIFAALALGGSASGEHGIGTQKLEYSKQQLLERNGQKVVDLMIEIKRLWDPNGILNPGKFILRRRDTSQLSIE